MRRKPGERRPAMTGGDAPGKLAPLSPWRPAALLLTLAMRRAARRRPEAFARLGEAARSTIVISADELPVVFALCPDGPRGRVTALCRGEALEARAAIRGPLADLLEVFDGSLDADAAFFNRRVVVDGDMAVAMALRNAVEAAGLDVRDIFAGLPGDAFLAGMLVAAAGMIARRGAPAEAAA